MSRKRRRTQEGPSVVVLQSPLLSWMYSAAIISTVLLTLPALSCAQKFDLCLSTIQTSDLDSNNILTSFEFNTAVSKFSGGTLNDLAVVWDNYSNNNVVRYIPIVSSRNLQILCNDIFDGILGDYNQKCIISLNFGDSDRDKALSETEFPKFAVQFTGWNNDTEVPSAVQSIYNDFATIDVVSPASNLTESSKAVCRHTGIAALMNGDNSPVAAPTNAPTTVTGVSTNLPADFTPTLNQAICERMMAFSDLSRDNTLNEDEYYRFVTRLNTQLENYPNYGSLPNVLRETFGQLATSGAIDVFGSKPGQTKTAAISLNLSSICAWTDYAIQKALDGAPPPTSTIAPTPTPVGIEFRKCMTDMVVADLSRDSFLNKQEYVRFIARNDNEVDFTDPFGNLTEALQQNFEDLAKDGLIDVSGSKPNQTPTAEQTKHLNTICQKTGEAIEDEPEGETGFAEVQNSFIISNDRGVRASGYTRRDRDELQVAYAEFLNQVIRNHTGNPNLQVPRRFLRGARYLAITSIPGVPTIDSIYDAYCPTYVKGQRFCATVFGSFHVNFVGDESSETLANQISEVVQENINPLLIGIWTSANATRPFEIEGPSYPVDPLQVKNRPNFDPQSSSAKPPIGPISAGLCIGVLVFGGALYLWKSDKKLLSCSRQRKSRKDETRVESDLSQFDDNAMGPYGMESAPSKAGFDFEKEDDEDNSERQDDDSVDFSVEEEPTEGEGRGGPNVFNAFRRGKKKHSSVEDDIRILEGDNDGFHVEGGDDFVNYAFEEPTELKQSKDDVFGGQNWADEVAGTTGWSEWGAKTTDSAFKKNDETFVNNENSNSDGSSSESESGSDADTSGADSKMSMGSRVSVLSAQSTVIGQMGVVNNGDRNSFVENGSRMEQQLDESASERSEEKSVTGSRDSISSSNDSSRNDGFANDTALGAATVTSHEKREQDFRKRVENLVRHACPEEFENIGNMMEQFKGRETELITTLQTLADRKDSQRRLKAVHKSKAIRERDAAGYTSGGAEGSAVIAAASMLNSDVNDDKFNDQDSFDEDDSYHSEDHSGSRSYSDDYDGEGSDTGTRTGSYDDEGSYTGSRSYDDEGSYTGSRSGSNDDDRSYTGSRSGSYSDPDRSYTEGSNGYNDEGSNNRGSRKDSYHSEDDPSQSYTGSYSGSYSGSHTGSRSDSKSVSGSGSYDNEGSFYGDDDG